MTHSADAFFVCSTRKQRIETDFQDDKESSAGSIVMLTNFNDDDFNNEGEAITAMIMTLD